MNTKDAVHKPLFIYESEIVEIVAKVARHPHQETGGDLFGYWTHSGAAAVQYVIGPGPNARHKVAAFYQDAAYLSQQGTDLSNRFALQHIGEWHSHHELGLAKPSGGDANTVRSALKRYGFPRFVLIIGNLTSVQLAGRERQVTLGSFLFEAGHDADGLVCPWVVLPGVGPIRAIRSGSLTLREAPPYELRPKRLIVDDLRGSPEMHSPAELLGEHWYTAAQGQARLKREYDALGGIGLTPRMMLDDAQEVVIHVADRQGQVRYHLPHNYPRSAPTIVVCETDGMEHVIAPGEDGMTPWTPEVLLADLHQHVSQRRCQVRAADGAGENGFRFRRGKAIEAPDLTQPAIVEQSAAPGAPRHRQSDKGKDNSWLA